MRRIALSRSQSERSDVAEVESDTMLKILSGAVLMTALIWPTIANADKPSPKNCGGRLEMEIYLRDELHQQPAGFTVTSPAGRLELWTTKPVETQPGMFQAARWTGISINKATCIEVQGDAWIFVPWRN